MDPDFFGDLLDHHRLELVDARFKEILLARHDGVADLHDGLLPLLDVFHELDRRRIALADIIADFFRSARTSGSAFS